MSIKRGLVGFGMSTALAAGGMFCLNEWGEARDIKADRISCQNNREAVSICSTIVATPESINNAKDRSAAYGWLGVVTMTGAGIGTIISFVEAMQDENEPSIIGQVIDATIEP